MKFSKAMKLMEKGHYVKFPNGKYLAIKTLKYCDSPCIVDKNNTLISDSITLNLYDILHHNWEVLDESEN